MPGAAPTLTTTTTFAPEAIPFPPNSAELKIKVQLLMSHPEKYLLAGRKPKTCYS
jgi:hypothetical protein